jgi:hypothetical protein
MHISQMPYFSQDSIESESAQEMTQMQTASAYAQERLLVDQRVAGFRDAPRKTRLNLVQQGSVLAHSRKAVTPA